MATLKFYLDTRSAKKDGTFPLKIGVTQNTKRVFINLNISLKKEQWDEINRKVVGHPQRIILNNLIKTKMLEAESIMFRLSQEGKLDSMDVNSIRNAILGVPEEPDDHETTFAEQFRMSIERKIKPRTKDIYQATLNRIRDFCPDFEKLKFEDITKKWLDDFDRYLSSRSPSRNARNIHLRNIRAVFNEAIDDDVTTCYPFRRYKLKNVATPKRSLTVEELRTLFNYPCEDHEEKYRDIFKLIFYLAGINIVDLCHLKSSDIHHGRIEYYRSKTSRFYSIKLEPEAVEIIDKYRGRNWLLDILDRYNDYRDYARRMNENLKLIGETRIEKHGRKVKHPLFPNITTYWARHSWATIASSIDIPKDTIAAALGHGEETVTDVYIDFDQRKVDNANRLVIDFVNRGGK